jgi:hypothetical protein
MKPAADLRFIALIVEPAVSEKAQACIRNRRGPALKSVELQPPCQRDKATDHEKEVGKGTTGTEDTIVVAVLQEGVEGVEGIGRVVGEETVALGVHRGTKHREGVQVRMN